MSHSAEPINNAQRRAIFAAANVRGLSIDDIRALTPEGSISRLTYRQAYDLLKRLNGRGPEERRDVTGVAPAHSRKSPRRPKGIHAFVTVAQRNMIRYFRMRWGWSEQQFNDWLAERHFADARKMVDMASSADAGEVIELLKAVDAKREAAARRRAEPARCQMPRGHADDISRQPSSRGESEISDLKSSMSCVSSVVSAAGDA